MDNGNTIGVTKLFTHALPRWRVRLCVSQGLRNITIVSPIMAHSVNEEKKVGQ
jgi:hypothetical protein